jgi:hypothetical protein
MEAASEPGAKPLSNAELARVLSPLLLFVAHVVYLVLWSPDPFLKRWLDGSFSFFVSLVLCNIVRARVVARAAGSDQAPDPLGPAGEDDSAAADGNGRPEGGTLQR